VINEVEIKLNQVKPKKRFSLWFVIFALIFISGISWFIIENIPKKSMEKITSAPRKHEVIRENIPKKSEIISEFDEFGRVNINTALIFTI